MNLSTFVPIYLVVCNYAVKFALHKQLLIRTPIKNLPPQTSRRYHLKPHHNLPKYFNH